MIYIAVLHKCKGHCVTVPNLSNLKSVENVISVPKLRNNNEKYIIFLGFFFNAI